MTPYISQPFLLSPRPFHANFCAPGSIYASGMCAHMLSQKKIIQPGSTRVSRMYEVLYVYKRKVSECRLYKRKEYISV